MSKSNVTTENVYAFICQYIHNRDYSPSIREIAAGSYLAVGTVMRHLDKLEAWGWIAREPGQARSIRLLKPCNGAKKK